jgi:tRNA modification GTPase
MNSTIAAVATPSGSGGVAIIRVSGDGSKELLNQVIDNAEEVIKNPRRLFLREVRCKEKFLDSALIVFFKSPHSYTGLDLFEIHLHGNPLICMRLLQEFSALGARLAEGGEFTKLAFLNGKLDLLQAESVADLIAADSDEALHLAQEQISGRLSAFIKQIDQRLLEVIAEVAAHLDFSEEEIAPDDITLLKARLNFILQEVIVVLQSYNRSATIKSGFNVLLLGLPNAGKSSLFNKLLGEDKVIVTPIAGTTRDLVEGSFSLGGYKVNLCDSAGIIDSEDLVEALGIKRAIKKIAWAHLILHVVDGTRALLEEESHIEKIIEGSLKPTLTVANKSDLKGFTPRVDTLPVSTLLDKGMEELQKALVTHLEGVTSKGPNELGCAITSFRHYELLSKARSHLESGISILQTTEDLEIFAEELRLTSICLEELLGKVTTEDVLGIIFSKFCVGK